MNAQEHIRARLAADPQLFKPEPGESLVGVVVGRYTVHHDSYGDSPALRVWDGSVEWRWHAYGTVASGFVEETDPQFGDWVGVLYVGQEGSGEQAVKKWRTAHVPRGFEFGATASVAPASPAVSAPPVRDSGDGGPGVESSPPPEERAIPNEPEGEPTISAAQVAELKASFDGCPDEAYRKKIGAEFVSIFGKASDLPAWRYEEASGWLADALAEAPF